MDTTEKPVAAYDEFYDDPDRVAFWESLKHDREKARRYNTGWLNIINANWLRTQDKKFRLELEEMKLESQMQRNRERGGFPQDHAC